MDAVINDQNTISTASYIPTLADVPKNTYQIGDIDALRNKIFEKVYNTFKSLPPIVYGDYELSIENPKFAGKDLLTLEDERKALVTERDLTRKIVGDIVLRSKSQQKELARRQMTLANVPYFTRHGSFIFGGNSYSISNQARLKPGIYVRVKDNGDVDAFVNTTAGAHHYIFNPETGIFYLKFGQAILPLLSLLRFLGVSDDIVKQYWGDEIYRLNATAASGKGAHKLFRGLTEEEANARLKRWLDTALLDPSVTSLTLGVASNKITPEVILRSTQKMLRIQRGEESPDERDAVVFQKIVGPDDLIAEYLSKAHNNLRKFIPRVVRKNYDLNLIPTSPYDSGISDLLLGSSLAEVLEEINPTEVLDRLSRITKLGVGGIEEEQAIPDEARALHPTHMGFIDPAVAGKLSKVGVDLRIAWPVRKDDQGRLYTIFRDVRANKFVWRTPEDIATAVVAFPGELNKNSKYVVAVRSGRTGYYKREDVDYELPYGEQYFNQITNFVPAPGADFLQRVMMGQQMQLQAVPLLNREEPLVQGKIPFQNDSFQRQAAKYYGAIFASDDGTVEKVTPNEIVVVDNKGHRRYYELYNNYPFNRKTFLHNTPAIKVGDRIKKGQLLAYSNFTTKEGYPAFGINAYAAMIPYLGYNYEDAFVISESFAKKLMSEHMYQHSLSLGDDIIIGKDVYKSIFPGKYTEEFYSRYDDNGILKPGQVVKEGEPIILAVQQVQLDNRNPRKRYYTDASITWDHSHDGTVIDTHVGRRHLYASVKSDNDTIVGDKLSGRFGDKGVIAKIVPDNEMPVDSKGVRFDLLVNPQGLISRANPNQMLEFWLGKVAKATGKPVFLPAFHDDYYKYLEETLKAHNISPTDTIYDPKLGRKIPNVATGYKYIMKLHHMAESKLQERDFTGYTSEDMPAKGGKGGAKIIGYMELMGLLGHGAFNVIKDAKFVRGQRKENFWLEFMRGGNPQVDMHTFVYDKFINQLKGAGINVGTAGDKVHLFALTDSDIDKMARGRYITSNQTVKITSDGMTPVKGGLYDPDLTGGLTGSYWSAIKLAEPVLNPVVEDVVRNLLDLSASEFTDIIRGEKNAPGTNKTGFEGLRDAFSSYNVAAQLKKAIEEYKTAPESNKSKLIKRIRYLNVLKTHNIDPKDWFWTKVPVLPPIFRPISSTDKVVIVPDINALYQDLYEANEILSEQKKYLDYVGDEREAVYNAIKAIVGLGDPIQASHKMQKLKGLLEQIVGPRAKYSVVQRKLLGTTTDLVGRAVIIPNPNLNIDHVGIPEEQAWVIFKPFIIRNLVKRGMSLVDAIRQHKEQGAYAKQALQEEIGKRVVLINRAPVLHRYGIMAFYPVLTQNKTIEFNPQVIGVFAADFDGDAVQVHVPVTEEAQKEAKEKMLPSRNLFSSGKFTINYPPIREYALGLWLATHKSSNKPVTYVHSTEELLGKIKRGELDVNDPVVMVKS